MITGRGYRQIELLKQRFIDEKIDAVYSSDLRRARDTAEALSQPRGLPVQTTALLREVYFGVWEDMTWGDLEYHEPQQKTYFTSDPARWSVEGSESFDDVAERVTQFIEDAAKKHDGETIALFTHGFAIRTFFCRLMGFKSSESRNVLYCDNTAVALLHYEFGKVMIEYQSDNSHLSDDDSTFAHQTWWRAEKKWASDNTRFMPLDEARDAELIALYKNEMGGKPPADKEYAVFLAQEPIGLLGITVKANRIDSQLLDRYTQSSDGAAAGKAGWISYMYLKPEYRRMRIGVQLLGQAISDFRKLRREWVRLEAPSDNPIVNMCLRDGGEIILESDNRSLLQKNIRIW